MIIDFIGALATGFGLLGVVLVINRVLLRNRFDRWIYPASVALGMVGYTVWAEYTWASRTIAVQPQLRVAMEAGDAVVYRPWTYVIPQVSRMTTVDLSATRVHADHPDLVLTQLVFIARWQPVRGLMVMFDCAAPARADLGEGVTLNADGTLEGADWIAMEADDAVLVTACAAGEEIRNERTSGT